MTIRFKTYFLSFLIILLIALISNSANASVCGHTPPTVTVTITPDYKTMYDKVDIKVVADTSPGGISDINIQVDGEIEAECPSLSSCHISRRYTGGTHNYFGYAQDDCGNIAYFSGSFYVNVVPPVKKIKAVFVPINYYDLNDFNSRIDAGVNKFISSTAFSEPGLGPVLNVQKLSTTCVCNPSSPYNPMCEQQAFQCVQAAGIYDYDMVIALVNNVQSANAAFYLDSNYGEIYDSPPAGYQPYIIAHEMHHYFNYCDTYNKYRYDEESVMMESRKIFNLYLYGGCFNAYPLNGIGPVGSCTQVCILPGDAACSAGVCGTYLNDGSSYPYNVDLMGNPFKQTGDYGWIANPVKDDKIDYDFMTRSLLDFSFSPGGATMSNLGSSDPTTTMQLLYTINSQNNRVSLKMANRVDTEVDILQPGNGIYKIQVYGKTGSLLFDKPLSVTFASTINTSLKDTYVYQRIPWTTDSQTIKILKSGSTIATFSMTDTDGDGIPDITDTDDDNDGFNDSIEFFVGTNPLKKCSATSTPNDEPIDAWPPDTDDDQKVTISDILKFAGHFNINSSNVNYTKRYDLNADGKISMADILTINPFWGRNCKYY